MYLFVASLLLLLLELIFFVKLIKMKFRFKYLKIPVYSF
jgi:hypothetical protein